MPTDIVTKHKEWKRANPLRQWRNENGVTIHEAASMVGCSMTSIQLWESGGSMPTETHITQLEKLIGPNTRTRWDRWYGKNPARQL